MYLMNKVRKLPDKVLYEVIEYEIGNPLSMRVWTVDRGGLPKFLTTGRCDFKEERGFLISSAESRVGELFEDAEVEISIEPNLFSLLMELVQKDAFFIPTSIFVENQDYTGQGVANFSNIRVSSSTMYVGFSLLHENRWASSKILYVEDGKLQQKPFFVAVPEGVTVSHKGLKCHGSAKFNGKLCTVFEYTGLPINGEMYPGTYLPAPLFNYLNLQYTRCLNASRFFSDIFDRKGILSSSTDYEPRSYDKAVLVTSSIKNPSRVRRLELIQTFHELSGNMSDLMRRCGLNPIEQYAFILISNISGLKTTDELVNLMKLLKVNRSLYSLALMMLRCQVFEHPDCFFPDYFDKVIARGGGGGDDFVTTVKINNY